MLQHINCTHSFFLYFKLTLCLLTDCYLQKVQHAQGKALADEYGINFFETSAKMNSNVDEAFLAIASDIVGRLRENPEHYGSEGGVSLNNGKKKSSGGGCC
jgi:Ras-related protein Rab-8A